MRAAAAVIARLVKRHQRASGVRGGEKERQTALG